jgi:hypothetical protein
MRVPFNSQVLIEGRKTMRLFILGTLVLLCFLSVGKNAQASEPESLQPSTTQAEGTINQTNANKLNRILSIDRLVMKYAWKAALTRI